MKRLFVLAAVLAGIVLLSCHDCLAAPSMEIKLPEDPTKAYITLGTLVVLASSGVSIFILHRKTSLWNKLKQKYLHLNG